MIAQNSSLVLTTDNKDRITGEPSGEPETLWGRINPGAFGDRVHRSKPAELEDRMKKSKDKRKTGGKDQAGRLLTTHNNIQLKHSADIISTTESSPRVRLIAMKA